MLRSLETNKSPKGSSYSLSSSGPFSPTSLGLYRFEPGQHQWHRPPRAGPVGMEFNYSSCRHAALGESTMARLQPSPAVRLMPVHGEGRDHTSGVFQLSSTYRQHFLCVCVSLFSPIKRQVHTCRASAICQLNSRGLLQISFER